MGVKIITSRGVAFNESEFPYKRVSITPNISQGQQVIEPNTLRFGDPPEPEHIHVNIGADIQPPSQHQDKAPQGSE